MNRLAFAVERSGDSKLSSDRNVSATWVPQQSCPTSCPLRANGCYAEYGKAGITTRRANKAAARVRAPRLRELLARQEAAAIRALTGLRKLRVHVVGDCATAGAAAIVGKAMVAHERKAGKVAWTYTHAWRTIAKSAWQGARVLASCHSPADVRAAADRGYAAALTVPPHPQRTAYDYHGLRVVPCPAQFSKPDGSRLATCEHCRICQSPELLAARGLVVGFAPDGVTHKRVLTVIQAEVDHARLGG